TSQKRQGPRRPGRAAGGNPSPGLLSRRRPRQPHGFHRKRRGGSLSPAKPRAGGALGALAADRRVPQDRPRQLAGSSPRQWPRLARRATERADGLRGGAPYGQITGGAG